MQGFELHADFTNLPWQSLELMANWHEKMAKSCRSRSQVLQKLEIAQKICADRVEYMSESYKVVLHYLGKGYNSTDSAIAAAARDLQLTEDCVSGWYKLWIKKNDAASKAERNRAIIDLVKLGVTNKDIAARLGIHANTVTRAINGYLFNGIRPSDRARLYKRRKK